MALQQNPQPIQKPPVDPNKGVTFTPFGEKIPLTITIGQVRNMLTKPTKKGLLPDDDTIMSYLVMARSMGLNPFCKDCFLVGYDKSEAGKADWSIITAHQAFLKRAETHDEYDGMDSGVIVQTPNGDMIDREGDFLVGRFVLIVPGKPETEWQGDILLGGWAIVYFKSRKHPTKRRLNLYIYRKDTAFWNSFPGPAGMIVKCAEADALRSSFPTLLGGLHIEEEIEAANNVVEVQEVRPSATAAIAHLPVNNELPKARKKKEPVPVQQTDPPGELAEGEIPNQPQAAPKTGEKTLATLDTIRAISAEAKRLGMQPDELARTVKRLGGRRTIEDCTEEAAQAILCELNGGEEPPMPVQENATGGF